MGKKKGPKSKKPAGTRSKKGEVRVTVQVASVGEEKAREAELTLPKGATVGDALAAANVSSDKMNVSIGGKVVDTGDAITKSCKVQVTERAQGS